MLKILKIESWMFYGEKYSEESVRHSAPVFHRGRRLGFFFDFLFSVSVTVLMFAAMFSTASAWADARVNWETVTHEELSALIEGGELDLFAEELSDGLVYPVYTGAIESDNPDVLDVLAKHDVDFDVVYGDKKTMLRSFVVDGKMDMMKRLLDLGADVSLAPSPEKKFSPLALLLLDYESNMPDSAERIRMADVLLSYGAKLSDNPCLPAQLVSEKARPFVARLTIVPPVIRRMYVKALSRGLLKDKYDGVLEYLISKGMNINMPCGDSNVSPMDMAAMTGATGDIIDELALLGDEVNDEVISRALIGVVLYGQSIYVFDALLAHGADINALHTEQGELLSILDIAYIRKLSGDNLDLGLIPFDAKHGKRVIERIESLCEDNKEQIVCGDLVRDEEQDRLLAEKFILPFKSLRQSKQKIKEQ